MSRVEEKKPKTKLKILVIIIAILILIAIAITATYVIKRNYIVEKINQTDTTSIGKHFMSENLYLRSLKSPLLMQVDSYFLQSNKSLDETDFVRARIVALSLKGNSTTDCKIGLTMRQPGLGRFELIEEEKLKYMK